MNTGERLARQAELRLRSKVKILKRSQGHHMLRLLLAFDVYQMSRPSD